jgi:hypothetical protein
MLLLIALVLILWATLPNPRQSSILPVSYDEMQNALNTEGIPSMSMEARQVVLEWPKTMRIGEIDEIRLKFEALNTETTGTSVKSEAADIYSRYNIMAEARFEVAGLGVNPANPTRESLPAGEITRFRWEVGNDQEGSFTGKVWLSVRLLPLDGGKASQVPVYIQEIKIQTVSLFGLNEGLAYLLGGVGIVAAGALVSVDLISGVRKWRRENTLPIDTDPPKYPKQNQLMNKKGKDEN